MDIEVARHTVRQAFRTAWELQDMQQFLKERCSAEEYQQYAADLAKAIDAVSVALLNRAMKAHPELEREIEDQIACYGRYL
jgi:hypothetical protein